MPRINLVFDQARREWRCPVCFDDTVTVGAAADGEGTRVCANCASADAQPARVQPPPEQSPLSDLVPDRYDFEVAVCCRGETGNGGPNWPKGKRRYRAVLVDILDMGPSGHRITRYSEGGCYDTPEDALRGEMKYAEERRLSSAANKPEAEK